MSYFCSCTWCLPTRVFISDLKPVHAKSTTYWSVCWTVEHLRHLPVIHQHSAWQPKLFRGGLVIIFLICLLCLLGNWDSGVNARGTILPEKVRQFFKYQMCTLVTLHTVPLTSYHLPAWFISQRINTGGIRDCRGWDIILETAEDEIFLWLKLLYIQKPHSILLQRHSVQPL